MFFFLKNLVCLGFILLINGAYAGEVNPLNFKLTINPKSVVLSYCNAADAQITIGGGIFQPKYPNGFGMEFGIQNTLSGRVEKLASSTPGASYSDGLPSGIKCQISLGAGDMIEKRLALQIAMRDALSELKYISMAHYKTVSDILVDKKLMIRARFTFFIKNGESVDFYSDWMYCPVLDTVPLQP